MASTNIAFMINTTIETTKLLTPLVIYGTIGSVTIDPNTHLPLGWVLGGLTAAITAAFWAGRNYAKIGQTLTSIELRLSMLENKVKSQQQHVVNCEKCHEQVVCNRNVIRGTPDHGVHDDDKNRDSAR